MALPLWSVTSGRFENRVEQLDQASINFLVGTQHSYGLTNTNPELEDRGYGEAVLKQWIE